MTYRPPLCPVFGGHQARLGTGMLLCRRHWLMVPKPLRDQVWAAWARFREAGEGLRELRDLRVEAIRSVEAECESRVRGDRR